MLCKNCGNNLPEGAQFCDACGASTGEQPASAQPFTAATQSVVATQAPAYATAPAVQPLSVGQYLGMFLLMIIPIVNIILVLVWSFGGSVNPNKKNYARATLVLFAISILLMIISGGAFLSLLGALM